MPLVFAAAASCRPYRGGVELLGLVAGRRYETRFRGVSVAPRPAAGNEPVGRLRREAGSAMVSRWTGDYPPG